MDPDKVQGNIQRPYNQQEPEQSDNIDPEKFKRVMKVEDTDESQKRNKRNLKKEEEEGDDETEGKVEAAPPTSSAFSEFMSDKDDLQNVLDSESGGVRYRAAPEESESFVAPQPGSINTEGVELDEESFAAPPPQEAPPQSQPQQPPQQQEANQPYQPPQPPPSEEGGMSPQFYEGQFQEQPSFSQTPDQNLPTDESTNAAQTPQQANQKQSDQGEEKPAKKEEDSSLLASQPKMSDLMPKSKKKKAPKPQAEIKTLPKGMQTPQQKQTGENLSTQGKVSEKEETPGVIAPLSQEGTFKAAISGEEMPIGAKAEMEGLQTPSSVKGENIEEADQQGEKVLKTPMATFRRMSPQEIRKERLEKESESVSSSLEGIGVPSAKAGAEGESGKDKKDDDHTPEATAETASIALPISPTPITAIAPTSETPSYTKLSPEIHELFEKMGGVMIIQADKGVTTTTMDINMPNSVFNGAQVILDQYSTAPHSFNLQLVGSPEAVKAFAENLDSLKSAYTQGRYNFEVNILTPSISSPRKSPHLIRRKGSAGGKGGSGGKNK